MTLDNYLKREKLFACYDLWKKNFYSIWELVLREYRQRDFHVICVPIGSRAQPVRSNSNVTCILTSKKLSRHCIKTMYYARIVTQLYLRFSQMLKNFFFL